MYTNDHENFVMFSKFQSTFSKTTGTYLLSHESLIVSSFYNDLKDIIESDLRLQSFEQGWGGGGGGCVKSMNKSEVQKMCILLSIWNFYNILATEKNKFSYQVEKSGPRQFGLIMTLCTVGAVVGLAELEASGWFSLRSWQTNRKPSISSLCFRYFWKFSTQVNKTFCGQRELWNIWTSEQV